MRLRPGSTEASRAHDPAGPRRRHDGAVDARSLAARTGDDDEEKVGGARRAGSPEAQLTPEQLLAIQLYARGYTDEQIGAAVGQPPGAVATLLALIARRLGVADSVRAVREARRRGLIM